MPKPATKPTIAVDIDEVISAQTENLIKFAQQKYGLDHSIDDFRGKKSGEYWKYWGIVWGVTEEKEAEIVDAYYKQGGLLSQKPVTGALEALKKLKAKYKLVVITARHDHLVDDTHHWLKIHFPKTFDGIEFAQMPTSTDRETKAAICQRIGADYLIDDYIHHCNLAAEAGVKALLFDDYGWNLDIKPHAGVVKVADWPAVLRYFNAA